MKIRKEITAFQRTKVPRVFNGDMGIIREINEYAENLTVEFDEGKMVEYSFKQLEELELVLLDHHPQIPGKEYLAVIIPMHSGSAYADDQKSDL